MTPTPVPGNVVLGQWTINTALGKGTSYKVYSATNQGSEVAAVKMVERSQRNTPKIKKMRDNLKELTRKIKEENCDRIIHLCEMIPAEELEAPLHSLQFELVYFVMSPAVSMTLSEFMPHVDRKTGSLQSARLLRELLEGLHFLHSHSWLHGDIKPDNIGISKTHAIILDVDTIVSLPPNQTLSPTPGSGGTISYLAPEREMLEYDHAVDVWAAGVVGHQLIYGYHPFQLATNPWRPGQEHHVPCFKERYRVCCERLSSDNSPVAGLVLEMMRHQWDGVAGKIRVTAAEALVNPFWNCLEEVDLHGPEMKKRKQ
jgi:serine/threonine protein kinase